MKLFLVSICLLFTACATPPAWLANHFDRNDPCQNFYRDPNYRTPDFCGASGNRISIYDNRGNRIGYAR